MAEHRAVGKDRRPTYAAPGRAVALEFARRGVNVAFNYVDLPGRDIGAQALMAETALRALGVSVYSEACDVRNVDAVERFVERARGELGGVHYLVNNAGITRDAALWRLPDQEWKEVIDTNITGAYHCTQAVARLFRAQHYGKIVNVQGWGWHVTTLGYGDAQGGSSENTWYTLRFSGTSSASPIVTGAVACLQGRAKAKNGSPMTPDKVRKILVQTGTPQQAGPGVPVSQHIGPLPNLVKAMTKV